MMDEDYNLLQKINLCGACSSIRVTVGRFILGSQKITCWMISFGPTFVPWDCSLGAIPDYSVWALP